MLIYWVEVYIRRLSKKYPTLNFEKRVLRRIFGAEAQGNKGMEKIT